MPVHFALHQLDDGVHRYRTLCGLPDATLTHWTTNRFLVSCAKCRRELGVK